MSSTLFFIAGLILLILAGDFLVRGAVSIANRFHVPPLIIGLTIISMGTSAPELFVSLQAALEGAPGLAVGNAVGSNIANALVVLGLPALVAPIYFTAPGIRRSALFMIVISLGFAFIAADGMISALDGLIFVVALVVYLLYSVLAASKARQKKLNGNLNGDTDLEIPDESDTLLKSLMFLAFGFIGLAIGARLIVDGALGLAAIWGIGETVIGTTIVAFGTTLPEIAATLAASFRREAGMAIGNVIGSNIFNLLGILGITAMLFPLPVVASLLQFDLWVLLFSSALIGALALMRRPIGKLFGLALTAFYATYLFMSFTG
ncbi:Inner membrane protein YrbG, predicted calcium/sodium:proton antiporter [hydrothermal vent metagenome]|uniref:Inner membrane protein YrbG, predicted calcium/sodium:proton antiporter n=1 Tax=hydrothermal vent metagenome TaxID=652676 RepID=A0A3B0UE56_9ZZZZ